MNYIEVVVITADELNASLLMDEMADAGFESFVENDQGFSAYIPEKDFSEAKLKAFQYFLQGTMGISWKMVPEQNWNAEWEKNFEPVTVDDFCSIRAPFHDPIPNMKYEIVIEPKMSFGTGHHETTSNMIRLMSGLDLKGKTVLDMGCGTAVLAILAGMMGAEAITAIDNDEWAYNNSIENIERNSMNHVTIMLGDASLLETFPAESFDVVLANINRNILLRDMAAYARVLKQGGILLLSGFYSSDRPMIVEHCKQFSITEERFITLNDWVALASTKKIPS